MWRAARRLQRPEEADTPQRWAEGQSLWLASAKLKLVDGCNLVVGMLLQSSTCQHNPS